MEYLTSILSSKVYDVASESPLDLAPKLSARLGVNFYIKREDLQQVIFSESFDNVRPPLHCFWFLRNCFLFLFIFFE
jgi:hypothetical protein